MNAASNWSVYLSDPSDRNFHHTKYILTFSKKMFYIYFMYCYFKRLIPRTGVHNKNNPGKSECMFNLIYPNGITTGSRWINNRLNCCNWQRIAFFTKSILELLQRLVLYKTSANTSSKGHPIWALSGRKIARTCSLCAVFLTLMSHLLWQLHCVNITPQHGRPGRILRTRNPLIPVFGLMGPTWFLKLIVANLSSWACKFT